MPIALYFKAILNEYSPDIRKLGSEEVLHFYNDYPHERSTDSWFTLYRDFGDSPESLEARWRIAKHWAGREKFESAEELLIEAQSKVTDRLKLLEGQQKPDESLFNLFQRPPESVMTVSKLKELQRRIEQTLTLIGAENRSDDPEVNKRLSQFVMLNPHMTDYSRQINMLLQQTDQDDPLRDNIMLIEAKLTDDEQLRIEKLSQIHKKYPQTDGGRQALYELGFLRFTRWRQQGDSDLELMKKHMEEARTTLEDFNNLYPESFYIEQVRKYLDDMPSN
jgi:hypothetical protein